MTDALENKDKLFQAAVDLFAVKGYKGTSVRDIAEVAGITSYNIYYYFGNKEGLLLAILEQASRKLLEKLRQVTEQDVAPLPRFKLLIETHIRFTIEYANQAIIFSLGKEHLSSKGWELDRRLQRDILELYLSELRKLQALGIFRCQSLTILAFNIFGAINWLLRWYNSNGLLSIHEVTDEIVSFILPGVIARSVNGDKPGSGALKATRSKLKNQLSQSMS